MSLFALLPSSLSFAPLPLSSLKRSEEEILFGIGMNASPSCLSSVRRGFSWLERCLSVVSFRSGLISTGREAPFALKKLDVLLGMARSEGTEGTQVSLFKTDEVPMEPMGI